jgi:hypothetical protein
MGLGKKTIVKSVSPFKVVKDYKPEGDINFINRVYKELMEARKERANLGDSVIPMSLIVRAE